LANEENEPLKLYTHNLNFKEMQELERFRPANMKQNEHIRLILHNEVERLRRLEVEKEKVKAKLNFGALGNITIYGNNNKITLAQLSDIVDKFIIDYKEEPETLKKACGIFDRVYELSHPNKLVEMHKSKKLSDLFYSTSAGKELLAKQQELEQRQ
jgi:hypothetical protein